MKLQFDLIGRLQKINFASNAVRLDFAIYEAVYNAIHAIEDRFQNQQVATQGRIDIKVEVDRDGPGLASVEISDNGIGLNPQNFDSFCTCDSRNKVTRGGKGIGRLVWLTAFDLMQVESTFLNERAMPIRRTFVFKADANAPIDEHKEDDGDLNKIGTTVKLIRQRAEFAVRRQKNKLASELALHFFSFFMANTMPRIFLHYERDIIDISLVLQELVGDALPEVISIPDIGNLLVRHSYVQRRTAGELANSILLTAHGRVVEPQQIGPRFALDKLSDGKAYIALVSGDLLDDKVDQERTGFKLTPDQRSAILEALIKASDTFLSSHISQIRSEQRLVVQDLLYEHPQFQLIIKDLDDFVNGLSPSMDEDAIGRNVFTLLYRSERRISADVRDIANAPELTEEIAQRAKDIALRVGEQAQMRLAEYVVKRRQVLDMLRGHLRRDEHGEYVLEETLHDLICPMREFYTHHDYRKHNLWILDDLLAFYQFFSSDKTIRIFTESDGSTKEPDLLFCNPAGFRRPGTNEAVVIVEFKRPGDKRASSDPTQQVLIPNL